MIRNEEVNEEDIGEELDEVTEEETLDEDNVV